jgi:hypothetical protein
MLGLGLITQGLSSIYGIGSGISQRKAAKKINPDYFAINDPRLNTMASPYAQQMLGRAQMQVNARMPGAAQRERQLLAGTAGTQAAISRGATDMSSAMQGILAAQAMGADQINNQALMEAQFQQQREGQLMNAQQTMIGERDKAFNAMNQKYMMDLERKNALQNAAQESISGGLGGLAAGFFSAARAKAAGAKMWG